MIKRYDNFINERLGVPEGNVESATIIFNELVEFVKIQGDDIITNYDFEDVEIFDTSGIKFNIGTDIKVGDIVFKNTILLIEVVGVIKESHHENIDLAGMAAVVKNTDTTHNAVLFDKNNIRESGVSVKIVVKENTTFNDFYNFLLNNKAKVMASLSHEVKHLYDKCMLGKQMFGELASYNIWSNKRLGIPVIDKFIFYLYLISKAESLVRSSEIAGGIVSASITKDEFKEFLESTDVYQQIMEMKSFSYENMKSDLYNDIDTIKLRLEQSDIDVPESEDEIVDYMLHLTYENIVGSKIQLLADMMGISDSFRQLLGLIKKEEQEYFDKFIKKNIYKNKEEYFAYCEKLIKFEANKVLKKISKLYDMCKDTNVNPLQSKITDKSIINPKLHDKYVADNSIKNYESFFSKLKK